MDGNVFGLVLLLLLLGGNGVDSFVRHRQRNTDREADKARWAALAEELREMKNSLNGEYLLREQHMQEHATLDDKLRALTDRVAEHDKQFSALTSRSRRQ